MILMGNRVRMDNAGQATNAYSARLKIHRSCPQIAVECAVLDRLAYMVAEDVFRAGEVGDGAGDF